MIKDSLIEFDRIIRTFEKTEKRATRKSKTKNQGSEEEGKGKENRKEQKGKLKGKRTCLAAIKCTKNRISFFFFWLSIMFFGGSGAARRPNLKPHMVQTY